jgi:murein DD-endopeptidase MepM/ murein hydrolase activator NlpD
MRPPSIRLQLVVATCLTLLTVALPAAPSTAVEQPYAGTRPVPGPPGSGAPESALDPATGTWPLRPRPEVAAGFDAPEEPWASGHRGVDLVGTVGQPVHAALSGEVAFVGRIAGVGIAVVSHGETRTTYQPVEASVAPGDQVAAGDVLGTLAWFGSHCMPRACLHWGWVRGSTYLDPLDLVGGGPRPVRLLPMEGEAGVVPNPTLSAGAVLARHLVEVP